VRSHLHTGGLLIVLVVEDRLDVAEPPPEAREWRSTFIPEAFLLCWCSRPDSGLDFQVKVLRTFEVAPSSLGSESTFIPEAFLLYWLLKTVLMLLNRLKKPPGNPGEKNTSGR